MTRLPNHCLENLCDRARNFQDEAEHLHPRRSDANGSRQHMVHVVALRLHHAIESPFRLLDHKAVEPLPSFCRSS
jgi:hypothetical protein